MTVPHPSRGHHVHPWDGTSILVMPRPFRRHQTVPNVHGQSTVILSILTSIPGTPRPSRGRHVHPGDATSIPGTPRPSRGRHVHPGDATSIPGTPRPSRYLWMSLTLLDGPSRCWAVPHGAGQSLTPLGSPSRRWAVPHAAGRSLMLLGGPPHCWAVPQRFWTVSNVFVQYCGHHFRSNFSKSAYRVRILLQNNSLFCGHQ